MSMVAYFLISILAIATPATYAVQHIVGDSSGWTNSGDYTTWAASKTFNVGDTLLFNYGSSHGVDSLSKADYDNCATGNAINSYTGGATTIKLTKPGPMFFACPSFGHCSLGMKLAINVVSQTTTTPSSDNNQSPPSSTTPSTPATSSPDGEGGSTGGTSMVVVGLSMILAPMIVFMC
ncbi:mavicyanin-like [Cynara cardunculus var. scolymus]|uniref:Cupredoxin n=1 Tax=Cynara cardunculus var. scolymus TaxID=59895 RepID=A0A103XEL9_CYNCS|nr:mavicyanin-like [Cynara cardunculus var. scolymus]KVH89327.1 Cupredoxin [Cynara cardunculus var. scolymus]